MSKVPVQVWMKRSIRKLIIEEAKKNNRTLGEECEVRILRTLNKQPAASTLVGNNTEDNVQLNVNRESD